MKTVLDIAAATSVFVLGYFFVLNTIYLVTSLLAFRILRRYVLRLRATDIDDLITEDIAPPVTVLVPTYNEVRSCVETTRAILQLDYPHHDILLINDGSIDGTLERLRDAFDLHAVAAMPTAQLPSEAVRAVYHSRAHANLWLIDKVNGGKADALNAGLNFTRTPYYCAIDADTVLEPDSMKRLIRPFLEDERTIAAGGIIRIVNGCRVENGVIREVGLPRGFLGRMQVVEYLRAFLAGRTGWAALKSPLIISGAFGLFLRSVVVDAGGYRTDTVGEDMELVVRLHRHCREKRTPYEITFIPDPVAWTQVPENLRELGRQRDRWQRGLTEALWAHRTMMLNPRYGVVGLFGYPFYFLFEMLGPVVETFGYVSFLVAWALGIIPNLYMYAFFAVAVIWGVALSLAAVGLEELTFRRYPRVRDLASLFIVAVIENFGYRQLMTFWRFFGLFGVRRRRRRWGVQEDRGYRPDAA